jgi:UDP-N-acetylglucosamine:LPS N-acetylglucosamine transferase
VKTIDLVYFNAGGGHRAAALALEASIAELGMPWLVRLVNLTQILDPKDAFRKTMGFAPEDFYNRRLAHGWTFGLAQELKILQGIIRVAHKPMTRKLCQHWIKTRPDMVVSLVPNFNRAMYQSLCSALPGVPYVTVLTDMADHPPNFWIERGQAQHLICGTPRAVSQAQAAGYPDSHIHPTSGMIIRPDFYRSVRTERRAERCRLGLDPDRITGIVMFGGHGSRVMQSLARQLKDTQLILVCGHNANLARRLRAMSSAAPRLILEFTTEIQRYMRLADFFIGKPGPGSITEAVQQQLPVIVVRNSWTMPQERYNALWVRENNVGQVLSSYGLMREAVTDLAGRLEEYHSAIRKIQNRAVFEVPEILLGILQAARAPRRQVVRSTRDVATAL